jgi:hypothetical protein
VSLSNDADLTETNHVIDQGFTYRIRDWWNWHTDYRYVRFDQEADANFRSLRDGLVETEGELESGWDYGLHILDTSLEFIPARSLVLRPGLRLMKRDVTVTHDGVADPQASRRSKLVWPIFSAGYTPARGLSLRGDFQSITNGGSYTRISPRTDLRSRLIFRYDPYENLSIQNNLSLRNSEYPTTDFRSSYRSNATTLNYRLNDRLGLLAGFTYDSFFATTRVEFIRGTPPLVADWRDQTINRVWHAGVDARPTSRLGITLTGNYVRTTGAGEISGEPPVFGPLRWPLVTGTITFDFGAAGELALDLQRTYYIEEIVRGDNFDANLLNVRWTTEFGGSR